MTLHPIALNVLIYEENVIIFFISVNTSIIVTIYEIYRTSFLLCSMDKISTNRFSTPTSNPLSFSKPSLVQEMTLIADYSQIQDIWDVAGVPLERSIIFSLHMYVMIVLQITSL
jgi:hypothetical protein